MFGKIIRLKAVCIGCKFGLTLVLIKISKELLNNDRIKLFFSSLINFMANLKPRGFVIATGLHKLFSKTAAHVSEYLRCAWHQTL